MMMPNTTKNKNHKIIELKSPVNIVDKRAQLNSEQSSRFNIKSILSPHRQKNFPLSIQIKETSQERSIKNYEKY